MLPLWYFVAELENGCRVGLWLLCCMLLPCSLLLTAAVCSVGFCCFENQVALNSATTRLLISENGEMIATELAEPMRRD